MKGLLQKKFFGQVIFFLGLGQICQEGLFRDPKLGLYLGGKGIGFAMGNQRRAVFPKIAASFFFFDVVEMCGGVFSAERKQFVHKMRHGKKRRAGIESILSHGEGTEFSAGIGVGFKDSNGIILLRQPYGSRQTGHPCANNNTFFFHREWVSSSRT